MVTGPEKCDWRMSAPWIAWNGSTPRIFQFYDKKGIMTMWGREINLPAPHAFQKRAGLRFDLVAGGFHHGADHVIFRVGGRVNARPAIEVSIPDRSIPCFGLSEGQQGIFDLGAQLCRELRSKGQGVIWNGLGDRE